MSSPYVISRARAAHRRGGLCCCALAALIGGAAQAAPPTEGAGEDHDAAPRLISQVALEYPAEAIDERGEVTVVVTVDAQGAPIAVEVVSGPPLFYAAAEDAGWRLRFEPTTQDGAPSTARVVFRFEPPAPAEPVGDDEGGGFEMVIHPDSPDVEDTHARVTLDEEALTRAAGRDLAETVAEVPGVTVAGGSADVNKPIIRGQTERRLLILQDGVRHESQKWGPDHAPEIDPLAAGSVSVLRGAAGARYGPDAVGGVILVEPPPMRAEPGVGGRVLASGVSNGWGGLGAARLDLVPAGAPSLSLRVAGSYAQSASLSAPDYVLGNTASRRWNGGAAAQLTRERVVLRLTFSHYDLRAGVFYGVRSATPTEFQAQLDAERPASADLWTTSYEIDRPLQAVTHDMATLHVVSPLSGGGVAELTYAFQLNRRQEYEQVRDSVEGPQYDFTLRTHSLDLLVEHDERAVGEAGRFTLSGGVGAQGLFQENVYAGLPLLPNHRSVAGGVFVVERLSTRRVDVEAGARYDRTRRAAFLDDQELGRHERRGTLDPDDCEAYGAVARCATVYDAGTLSLGALWHVVPERLDLKLDLSTASRVPNMDELYLMGSAPTFPVYAFGSPDLGVETTLGASTTLGLRLPWLEGELSAFGSLIHDYIYFAPELTDAGEPIYDVTIRGAWPRYGFNAIDARYVGVDGGLTLGPESVVGLSVTGAVVRAQERKTGVYLVGTAPDRLRVSAQLRPPETQRQSAPELSVSVLRVARQDLVDPALDLAPAPPAYTLLGLAAEVTLHPGAQEVRVGFQADNLLNVAYRDYTSLLRYYADQPGRELRLRVSLDL